jgi:uncharacterized damage-inducible protein DinB
VSAFAALASTLDQLADAVQLVTPDEYSRRDLKASGSIGAHVRHCLDHVTAFERGIATGELCYDHRERDTVVERDPMLGVSRLRRTVLRLGGIGDYLLDRPMLLTATIADEGTTVRVATSVGRELAFVVSHTIHHNALVAVLMERMRLEVPARFGVAPTTPQDSRVPPSGLEVGSWELGAS